MGELAGDVGEGELINSPNVGSTTLLVVWED
jgi:hypothetical protein